ncbi:transporter substrate-binding domain-containing protein [Variovorax dokdonensis]|uniref:Transporter substrate-binding domain-containing protein n=1 Tax=Variovorax dokdonensis TaxID=344883 RepID=A0ABT7ND22_9BURK|nr:transporter substrate-binding domain-containing protein [Variovorax dokdonensis]MDM0045854.1 transporter substrate-binding domain-containing protein [Variovorax dokdonensis]
MSQAFHNPELRAAFAPKGALRASINLGNPILARRDQSGAPAGVSVDLARALARLLGPEIEFKVFEKAAASVDAVRQEEADIGFFAIDPARSEGLSFSAPYVLIEGSYLVPSASSIQANDAVDREGLRVAVGEGSAYDLFLTRELKAATIVRVPGAAGVMQALRAGEADVAAGIRQVLQAEAAAAGAGLRMLPGRFMVIQQAMGMPASRGAGAARALHDFVEAMKASGFVAQALERHNVQGASVAPAAQA